MSLVVCVMTWAQVTTSSLAGIVTDADGEVIGATVQAVHVPSGTHYGTITNEKGAYAIRGMRVGGPYEVTVSYVGASTRKFTDITLALGETFSLNVKLEENAAVLTDVVVVGSGSKFSTAKTGAATNISAAQIDNLPTISRSITDFTRLSPYGGNDMSFGGADGRTANFTIDGANFNNNFGLSDKLPGGGNPVSIDAIEEMQVVISPYDLRQTGFVGGGVNAVTKSGTNTVKGTAYVYHRNENMRGDAIRRMQINGARDKDQQTTFGFTLGGPIVKDKLFFFTSLEFVNTPTVANYWRASHVDNGVAGKMNPGEANASNYISRASDFDLQQVSTFIKQKYGYDTGSFTSFPADETNRKFLFKIDWNINENHHLIARYNFTKNRGWNAPNASSMDGGTRASDARTSKSAMSYANSMYAQDNLVNTGALELNSRFSDNLSNRFIATFSKLDDVRYTDSPEFPFIDILDGNGQNYISLGYELFTYNNAVHNTIWNIKDDVTYYMGNHKFTAGFSYEYQMADNMYMRNGTGYYRYKCLEDFLSSAAPEIVNLTYGYNGETDPAARVQFNKAGVYLQDEWNVTENLILNYGLRLDGLFFNNSDIMTNQAVLDNKEKVWGDAHFDTGKWPNSSVTVVPRVGATWDVFGDQSLKVRGGTGLFQGRLPLVFFTNMPTNSGMVQYNAQLNEKNLAKKGKSMEEFAGNIITNKTTLKDRIVSLGYPNTISPKDGTISSGMCVIDPDFKLPLVWKTSAAVDYAFPTDFPFSVSAEGIYTKNLYETTIRDYSVPSVAGFPRFNGVDNRPIFPTGFADGSSIYVLENTSKGYGFMGSFTVNAQPTKDINLMAAYTRTVKKELTSLPGSSASSVLNYVSTVEGPNSMKLHNGQNVNPDRIIVSASFRDKGNNHYSIIYETTHGYNSYSIETTNDMNGDGYNYDALYIPTDDEVANRQFRFVSADDEKRFMNFVHAHKEIEKFQGKYAEPYSLYSPWSHRIDLSYKHDFKFNVANTKHMLQLSVDVKNVANLFNSKWGVGKITNQTFSGSSKDFNILKFEGADAEGYATFSTPEGLDGTTPLWERAVSVGQCWYMSVGLKYVFN